MLSDVKTFRGCISRTEICDEIKTNIGFWVLNLDNADGGGTHWVCFYLCQNKIEYFDPFGIYPPQELVDFARSNYLELWYSTHQIQNIHSVACGYFCVYFILNRDKGREGNEILLDFTNDSSMANDDVVLAN